MRFLGICSVAAMEITPETMIAITTPNDAESVSIGRIELDARNLAVTRWTQISHDGRFLDTFATRVICCSVASFMLPFVFPIARPNTWPVEREKAWTWPELAHLR